MSNIHDFFDPYNAEHIEAYQHLCQTGTWPEGFIPEGMKLDPNWQFLLLQKLADAWVKHVLTTEIKHV